ncbi:MAG TPA: 50S ribosomal protein L2 [Candidatus Nanoarchaeia archaeon]|nr:50S ribosomal protein L2 [Candidatus Nanoarchaeia archaeon]
MGKNLIQQRRGKGSPTYRAPSHHFKGSVKFPTMPTNGIVVDLVHCAAHTAPLMEVKYLTGERDLAFAPEGIKIGDEISVGEESDLKMGNVLPLAKIPEGTAIYNIELRPGDGGKLVRSSGTFAKVVAKTERGVHIKLPSKKEKIFLPECRAAIGVLAGSGRVEKPFLKAGTRMKKMRARNKLYPRVCGISMNAVDHPFGGKNSHIKGRPTQSPRSAPPGRKVGKIAPRRTGRRR